MRITSSTYWPVTLLVSTHTIILVYIYFFNNIGIYNIIHKVFIYVVWSKLGSYDVMHIVQGLHS